MSGAASPIELEEIPSQAQRQLSTSIVKEKQWNDEEQKYLNMLCTKYDEMADKYMDLYRYMHSKQIRYRLPVIIFSSLSGIASFGTSSFPPFMQRYVSIGVGIVNVGISIIQAYESYIKLNDIVVKSYTISCSLKKLSDRIHVELYIPVNNRILDGDKYLREVLEEYEKIMADAPPLEFDNKSEFFTMHKELSKEIKEHFMNKDNLILNESPNRRNLQSMFTRVSSIFKTAEEEAPGTRASIDYEISNELKDTLEKEEDKAMVIESRFRQGAREIIN